MIFEWEELVDETTDHFTTHRAKVWGGWIVRTNEFFYGDLSVAQSESLVFIPDPEHKWVIEDE